MNDETRRRLKAAGRRPVPPPRPGFTDALEARLVAVARERETIVAPVPWWRRAPMRVAAGLAAMALAIALVLGNGLLDDRTTLALELTGSVNVEVALVDGTTLVDPDGLLLPDGAVVRVGTGGSARVGAVALGAGDVARVVDGRLRIDRRPSDQVVVPGTSAPSAEPPGSRPPESVAPGATAVIDPGSPRPTAPPASDRPSPAAPTRTPAPTDGPSRTAEPSTRTTGPGVPSTPKPGDAALLRIQARAVGRTEIAVSWSAATGADRYVLIGTISRDGAAPEPVYPGSRTIGDFTRPPANPLTFRVGEAVTEVRLRVVALSADGAVIARSPVATVALGG